MANKVKVKRTYTAGVVPTAAELQPHEFAVNWADGIVYVKAQDGTIQSVTLGGSGGVSGGGGGSSGGGSANIVEATTAAGFPATGAASTLYIATDASRAFRWTGSVYVEVGPSGGGGGLTWSSVPASPTASGTAGSIAYDANYIYTAVASNTWKRAAWGEWATDPYFSNVSLLLHMDGTGSTFVDSSGTPKTVTAYGNATQSTAQSKWGGKAAYFDGTGDYLTAPPIAFGTGDFCVEAWFRSSSRTQYAQLFGNETYSSSVASGFTLLMNNNGAGQVGVYGPSGFVLVSSSGDWTNDQWHHIALVRTGNSISLYLNGTRYGTGTDSNSYSNAADFFIGMHSTIASRGYTGYIDDLRVTLSSNRGYTGDTIPVPTAAFPDV